MPASPKRTAKKSTATKSEASRPKPRRDPQPAMANLKRAIQPMPAFVKRALTERGLVAAYRARPAFQQNDYLGWIARAKREETKQKRLAQMLDELDAGNVYMNMKWEPLRTRLPKG